MALTQAGVLRAVCFRHLIEVHHFPIRMAFAAARLADVNVCILPLHSLTPLSQDHLFQWQPRRISTNIRLYCFSP